MKAPNIKVELKNMPLPLIVSYKLDGIRCVFKDGEMLSCSLKHFPNVQLRKRFDHLAKLSKQKNIILDGELLAKSLTFNELSGLVRQLDKEIPNDLKFYCFDCVINENYEKPFADRINDIVSICELQYTLNNELKYIEILEQNPMTDYEEINIKFEKALAWGCDGVILRNPNGRYKCGRGTVKEGLIYKLKPFVTLDAKIIDILEGTVVREGAEKTTNELGYSRTSKLKEDRIPSGRACDFVVLYKGIRLKVSIAATDEEKTEYWQRKEHYIGTTIEYKGMLVGSKDLPRHPGFIRFRPDKD
jgi:DNA ligase-1